MGLGIVSLLKSLAPLTFYLCGVFLFFVALSGKVRWTLLLVVFLLPLRNVVDRLQALPLGNQFIDILIFAMITGWVVSNFGLGRKNKFMERSPLNVISVILVVYTFLSLQFGNNYLHISSLFNISDSRVQDWKNFCLLPILFFLTLNNIRDKKWVNRVFMVMCLSMALVAYYTSTQISWFSALVSRAKINGTFQFLGPNEVAAFFAEYTILLMSIFFVIKKSLKKTLLLLLILLNLYCIVFVYSRAAYGAMVAGMFFLFAIKNRKLLIPLILAVALWQVVLPEKAVERIEGTTDVYGQLDVSSERRLEVWQESMRLFAENPIVGIGYGTFRRLGFSLHDTHNIYVKILLEQGLVGGFIFLMLIFCFFKEGFALYRKGDDEFSRGLGLGLMSCIVVLLVGNFFGDRWSYLELSAYLWIFAGLASRLRVISEEAKWAKAANTKANAAKKMTPGNRK